MSPFHEEGRGDGADPGTWPLVAAVGFNLAVASRYRSGAWGPSETVPSSSRGRGSIPRLDLGESAAGAKARSRLDACLSPWLPCRPSSRCALLPFCPRPSWRPCSSPIATRQGARAPLPRGTRERRLDILKTERKQYSQHDEELIIRDFFQDTAHRLRSRRGPRWPKKPATRTIWRPSAVGCTVSPAARDQPQPGATSAGTAASPMRSTDDSGTPSRCSIARKLPASCLATRARSSGAARVSRSRYACRRPP